MQNVNKRFSTTQRYKSLTSQNHASMNHTTFNTSNSSCGNYLYSIILQTFHLIFALYSSSESSWALSPVLSSLYPASWWWLQWKPNHSHKPQRREKTKQNRKPDKVSFRSRSSLPRRTRLGWRQFKMSLFSVLKKRRKHFCF